LGIPWTEGRIAAFLHIGGFPQDRPTVFALAGGSTSLLVRLTIIPVTIAYISNPVSAGTVVTFFIFLIAAGGGSFLLASPPFWKKSLFWYVIWGWGAYFGMLVLLASYALEKPIALPSYRVRGLPWTDYRLGLPILVAVSLSVTRWAAKQSRFPTCVYSLGLLVAGSLVVGLMFTFPTNLTDGIINRTIEELFGSFPASCGSVAEFLLADVVISDAFYLVSGVS